MRTDRGPESSGHPYLAGIHARSRFRRCSSTTSIGYVRSGTGPALLLVHGTTADHRRWAAVAPRLEQHFTVYAMDRRGRGGSTDSPDYHILREADDVVAVTVGFGSLKRRLASPCGTVERCTVEISGKVAA